MWDNHHVCLTECLGRTKLAPVTEQPPTKFALALKRYRTITREGLTQRALAAELGKDPITLSRYERDASPVGDDWTAHELERLTGVAPPRTRAELSAQREDALRDSRGRGASRDVVEAVSEAGAPPARARPRRRRRGEGHV